MSTVVSERRRRWPWALGLVLVLLALLGYLGWSGLQVRQELLAGQQDARDLRSALVANDATVARTSLERLRGHTSEAHGRTDGPLWSIAERLPVVGPDARAVAVVSAVGDDLASGPLVELVDEASTDIARRLAPRGGRIDLKAVEQLQPFLDRTSGAFSDQSVRLRSIRPAGLSGSVRPAFTTFAAQVDDAAGALESARKAAQLMPPMLGGDGPRTYLLASQNNAEVRATGGLPGALAIIRADNGRLTLERQAGPTDIGQFDVGRFAQSDAERAIYHSQPVQFFQDTNFTPEFPRTAQLMRDMWATKFPEKLDGVLSLDTVSLGYLLRATGPVQVQGVSLTAANAKDQLLSTVYTRLPDNTAQDDFFRATSRGVFEAVSGGVTSPVELLRAFAQGTSEGRIYAHLFAGSEQRIIAGSQLAGDVRFTASSNPELGVYLNDATGSKLSYYLRTTMRTQSVSCDAGRQALTSAMDFTYLDPGPAALRNPFVTGRGAFGTRRGNQLVSAYVYGPVGGELARFRFDGKEAVVPSVDDRGRPVAQTVIALKPGQTVRMSWLTRTGTGQDGATSVSTSPGMPSQPGTRSVTSSCR